MGTDIHMIVQKFNGESWEAAPIHGYGDRSYRIFAALAGVRNGYGFAGIKTHEPLVPISAPRGLPADLRMNEDETVDSFLDDRWYDGSDYDLEASRKPPEPQCLGDHSHSYLTLAEILTWDGWDKDFEGDGPFLKAVPNEWWKFVDTCNYYVKTSGLSPEQIRLVFGFDS